MLHSFSLKTSLPRLFGHRKAILAGLIAGSFLLNIFPVSARQNSQTSPGLEFKQAGYAVDQGDRAEHPVAIMGDAQPALPSVSIVVDDPVAAEAGLDSSALMVFRSGSTVTSLTVEYMVIGTATAGKDYAHLSGSLTIPAGEASGIIVLEPIDDDAKEGAETVVIMLSPQPSYEITAPSSATMTIADDDTAAQLVSFSINDPDADETGPDLGRLTVVRNGSTAVPLAIGYTIDGTAINGTDYVTLSGIIEIPVGQSSVTIDLLPLDDLMLEGSELVVLALSSSANYAISAPASATIAIDDNDEQQPPTPVPTPTPTPAPAPDQRVYLPCLAV